MWENCPDGEPLVKWREGCQYRYLKLWWNRYYSVGQKCHLLRKLPTSDPTPRNHHLPPSQWPRNATNQAILPTSDATPWNHHPPPSQWPRNITYQAILPNTLKLPPSTMNYGIDSWSCWQESAKREFMVSIPEAENPLTLRVPDCHQTSEYVFFGG